MSYKPHIPHTHAQPPSSNSLVSFVTQSFVVLAKVSAYQYFFNKELSLSLVRLKKKISSIHSEKLHHDIHRGPGKTLHAKLLYTSRCNNPILLTILLCQHIVVVKQLSHTYTFREHMTIEMRQYIDKIKT